MKIWWKSSLLFLQPLMNSELMDITFTDEQGMKNLAKIKKIPSPGPDGLPYCVFKASSVGVKRTVLILF